MGTHTFIFPKLNSFLVSFILLNLFTVITPRNLQQQGYTYPNGMTKEEYYKKIILTIVVPVIAGVFVLCAFMFSFCKVPLRKGYRCRCGERTKWFIKALFYEIFFIFYLIHYLMKIFFHLLDLCWPDTKDEDNKLPPEEKSEKEKDKKFIEFREEHK